MPVLSKVKEVVQYTVSDIARMGYSWIVTRVLYSGATLIRRPISVRRKRNLHYGIGFTTGRNCRFESFGDGIISVGDDVHVGDNVHIASADEVKIGDGCLLASKVFITDLSHGDYSTNGTNPAIPPNERPIVSAPVSVGKNVWLGENVVVLQGVSIGDGAIVGASAVVVHDLPGNSISVGVPAKPIKRYDEVSRTWRPWC